MFIAPKARKRPMCTVAESDAGHAVSTHRGDPGKSPTRSIKRRMACVWVRRDLPGRRAMTGGVGGGAKATLDTRARVWVWVSLGERRFGCRGRRSACIQRPLITNQRTKVLVPGKDATESSREPNVLIATQRTLCNASFVSRTRGFRQRACRRPSRDTDTNARAPEHGRAKHNCGGGASPRVSVAGAAAGSLIGDTAHGAEQKHLRYHWCGTRQRRGWLASPRARIAHNASSEETRGR
mmetsp:Transcript_43928/g.102702  ORF Transcript_43928/g.102702 Transcript_43928/m.102702 type:complete len:238 (-) Transcript_43928:50-763(-)